MIYKSWYEASRTHRGPWYPDYFSEGVTGGDGLQDQQEGVSVYDGLNETLRDRAAVWFQGDPVL